MANCDRVRRWPAYGPRASRRRFAAADAWARASSRQVGARIRGTTPSAGMTSSPPCRGQLVRSQQAGSPAVIAEPGKSQVHHDRGMPPAGGVQEHCAELVCGGDVDLWGAVITRTPPVILRRYLISGTGAHLLRRTEAVPESQGVSARRGLRHAAAVRNPGLAPTMACPPGDRTPEPVGGEDREPGAARTWAWPGSGLDSKGKARFSRTTARAPCCPVWIRRRLPALTSCPAACQKRREYAAPQRRPGQVCRPRPRR